MKQREVQDGDGVRWVCVQAMAGVSGDVAEEAAAKLENDSGEVPVVCTPSGGAMSVRIRLPAGWEDNTNDEALLGAIRAVPRG